ncbi:conserved exported hypothetical protein [Limnobacter sp. 130]|jgi:hypothetical protein|uniref:DUF1329 domain-containing protein n=1 Tax=Limnobacter sp. 130 TaxID=2653147 RepID=UPI0012F17D25|nr:DUF1329 domain-containing protein [Limnobacter sp. 130]VWX35717.1 conserved exported hypothetical protein [Limnobacter sp. 130]
MNFHILRGVVASAVFVIMGSTSAMAQTGSTNALGAEIAGNAAGTIPEWTGGLTKPPAGFDPKNGYIDPFAGEKPLFVVNQSNLAQHEKFLPAGQIALIKRYPNYSIPVYKTHRTAAFSPEMMTSIKMEAGKVKLAHDGLAVEGVQSTSVPFPQPKNGLEAVWNTLLRRPAQTLRSHTAGFVAGNGSRPVTFASSQTIAWAPSIGKAGSTLLFALIGESTKPSAQSGEALLVLDTLNFKDDTRNAWIVNSGQRRVLRAPELVHAAPAGNTDALRTVDDIYGFNGSPERFDWKLLGKREMYIPYNNYKLSDKSLKYDNMLNDAFLKSELTRFELHRVWVIEGTLKPGSEHIYSKRTMYVDEDSWYVALMDQYDTKGELWRVKMLYLMQAYDAPGLYTSGEVQHDLNARKSVFGALQNEEPATEFNVSVRPGDFTPAALRKLMR